MLRVAAAMAVLLLGGAAVDGDAAAGKRKGGKRGKVVRVERPKFGGGGLIRTCQMSGASVATCYGRPPVLGDVGIVIDTAVMYGEARVVSVTPVNDTCNNITSWTVTVESSNAQVAQLSYGAILLIDYTASPQARSVPVGGQVPIPGARVGEYGYLGVDSDGDTDADLYVSAYTCDAAGNVIGYGQGHVGYCMGYWVGDQSSWTLLRTDVVRSC